ncbi:type III secretion protein HrpF [Duganella violaceipulchra]|uniref:Type III secretion protein HrpF n=1 Tax=Duganella violaceipulchra TaxID=2849652 RepID=A0AA41L435_9BURK|nr:type III secretion protein HrpF [Duganella violaceicalia]MBV6322449.1 type III secretion protein HrpF [Duganella violaceicalia]MCP2010654.1 hypothetical protein [Duganella violaceicalia]
MNSNNPMDRFVSALGSNMRQFDEMVADLQPVNPDDAQTYLLALQEMQMTNWAAGVATTRRHGLLKKIMAEIR